MSKRKMKDAHLPVGECIAQVCVSQFHECNLCYCVMGHCNVFVHHLFQVQEILRERLCRQQLPDRPEGVEAQHKYVYLISRSESLKPFIIFDVF